MVVVEVVIAHGLVVCLFGDDDDDDDDDDDKSSSFAEQSGSTFASVNSSTSLAPR